MTEEWVSTAIAAASLGVHRNHLSNLRTDGFLKQGIHWRDVRRSQSARPTYRWHLARVGEALATPAEQRD